MSSGMTVYVKKKTPPPVLLTSFPSSPSSLINPTASRAVSSVAHGPTRRNLLGKFGPIAQVKKTSFPRSLSTCVQVGADPMSSASW